MADGLPGDCRLLLPLAAEVRTAAPVSRGARAAALDDLQHHLRARGQRALVGATTDGDGVLAVLCLRCADGRDAAAAVFAKALRDFAERQFGSCEVTVAAGRTGDWVNCPAELRLARECALTALALPPACWHDAPSLELQRLLWRWRDDAELAEFVDRTLGPLLTHDRERKSPLLPTLEALLDNGGRKAETARALYLNRQALYNRVHRIEQLLGVDLSDSEARLTVHVALRARAQL
jgi:purine catabolism regulator